MKLKKFSKITPIIALSIPLFMSCNKGTHTCTCTDTNGVVQVSEYGNITEADAEDNCAEYAASHPGNVCELD